jgi:ubiquinone/menaquinone biosynthesis C-methylase UbiE
VEESTLVDVSNKIYKLIFYQEAFAVDEDNQGYYGLMVQTWDLWRDDTDTWEDRFFFWDIVREYGQPVLDVGCATGRFILEFLSQGIDTDGVDASEEMLAICRNKAKSMGLSPNLYRQKMESLDLPRRYQTILVPSSTLQLIIDPDLARTAVRRFFDHLLPGGAFVTPFSFAWQPGDSLDSGWRLVFEKTRPEDGAIVRRWSHEWHEPEKQVWNAEDRFEIELDGKIIQTEVQLQTPEGRWYTQEQAVDLFRQAGFQNIQLFKGFTHEPAQPDDQTFCVLGFKS